HPVQAPVRHGHLGTGRVVPGGRGHNGRMIVDGASLTCADVLRVAFGRGIRVEVAPEAMRRAEASWRLVPELVARRQLYGQTTGVGANRDELLDAESTP